MKELWIDFTIWFNDFTWDDFEIWFYNLKWWQQTIGWGIMFTLIKWGWSSNKETTKD